MRFLMLNWRDPRNPLAAPTPTRLAAAGLTVASCVALLIWFWPRLIAEGMAVPVTLYIAVLGAMVCAALLADLPTPWTALGAVSFAVSDAMIGISRFVLGDERLAVPIWWFYAASLLLRPLRWECPLLPVLPLVAVPAAVLFVPFFRQEGRVGEWQVLKPGEEKKCGRHKHGAPQDCAAHVRNP